MTFAVMRFTGVPELCPEDPIHAPADSVLLVQLLATAKKTEPGQMINGPNIKRFFSSFSFHPLFAVVSFH